MDVQKTNYDSVSKKYIYIVVGIVVLAIAAWGIYAYNHQNNNTTDNTQQAVVPGNSNNTQPATATPETANTPLHTVKQYEAALITYAKVRIQFLACQARPNTMTLKNPATIMLDNRSTTVSKIMIDKRSYYVPGLDYMIVTISEPLLPVHSQVDCNASQNVATLLIEK
jgi:hypothetical protein